LHNAEIKQVNHVGFGIGRAFSWHYLLVSIFWWYLCWIMGNVIFQM